MSAVLEGSDNENVLISWSLSADDGAGDNDVSHYAIYYSDAYDYDGEGYSYLGEVNKGESSFIHALAGDGDWSNYFYYVQANDTSGNSNRSGQAGKFVRYFEEGKQIASIPLVQEDTTLEVVLQTLEGSYKHIRYYKSSDQSHHWKSYWTFKTYRTLFEIDHTMGFWIDIARADYLVVAGLVPEVTYIALGHEWNFVGYPSFLERRVSNALARIDWMKVQGYNDVPPFHLKQLTGNDIMRACEGYWVWVDLPQVWEVPNKPSPPPYIVWTYPADGQTDVPLNTSILVKFSKEMNTSSVGWIVSPDPGGYSQYWSEGNTLLEILLDNPWPENTTFTFEIMQGEDLEDNPLVPGPVPNPWSFTTWIGAAPHVIMTDPYDFEHDVDLWRDIIIQFSTEIVPQTFHWNITPDPGGWVEIWSKTVYNNDTATLIHANPFDPWSNISVIVEHAKDPYGRDLTPGPYWFSFYTAGGGVYIILTSPSHQEIDVPLNQCIVIVFSEPMDPATVTFTIMPSTPVVVAWYNNNTTLEICPDPRWQECTIYAVEVTGGYSMSGQPLIPGPVPNPWQFRTICISPYIVSTDPLNGEVAVPLDRPITIWFSEPMDLGTLNFTSTPDPGGWGISWYDNDTRLVLTHNDFSPSTSYYVHIVYIEDKAGLPLVPGPVPNPFTFETA